MKNLFKNFARLLAPGLPVVTEDSRISEIEVLYPLLGLFLEKRYKITLAKSDARLSLKELCRKYDLPSSQIVFMEAQLYDKQLGVQEISALEAKDLFEKQPQLKVLDVREEWERKYGSLPKSEALTPQVLDSLLKLSSREQPVLVYCHFGVRSLDAASYLAENGFINIFCLKGGIDSWALNVDPSLPRYSGSYC